MARQTRQERHEAHRRAVEAEKAEIRKDMKGGGHFYFAEWYRHHRKNGDAVVVEAMEEMWDELARHDRDNPAPPNFGMDDGYERARDLESRRREARDLEQAAEIAEGARKKAAGIGGGVFATAAPEPEPEEDEGPDQEVEEYEQQRRALMGYGLVSRMPAPPQQPRKKKRKGYYGPPLVG